jgi:hypothetical protein
VPAQLPLPQLAEYDPTSVRRLLQIDQEFRERPSLRVAERLGHSSVGVTLDRYSHVVGGMDREAADWVASLILG